MSVFHLPQPTFIGGAQPFAPPIRKIPAAATALFASLSDTVSTRDALSSSPAGWTPRNLAARPGIQSIIGRWWAPPVIGQIASAPTPPLAQAALADFVSSSDAFVAIAFGISLADSASSSDGFTTSGQFTVSLSDTSATSDAISVTASARTTSDTIATSDSYLLTFLATASIADTVATSDSYTQTFPATGSITDSIATSDGFAGSFPAIGTLADTISVSDFFSQGGSLSGSLADSVATSDSYTRSFLATGSITDSVVTSDAYTGASIGTGTLSDTISATDLYSTGGVLTGSLSDSIAAADAYSGLMVAGGVIAESTATSDGYTGQPGLPLADTISTSDVYSSVFIAAAALLDTVITSDGYTFPGNYIRTLSDTASTSDTYQSFLDTPLLGPIIYGRSYYSHPINAPNLFWPEAQVGGSGFYIFDATETITFEDGIDPLVGASISTKPSGAGELAAQSVTSIVKDGQTYVIVIISGGVAGRMYIHQLVLATQSGQTIPVLIGQVCDPVLAIRPIPPTPSPAFGTTIHWP